MTDKKSSESRRKLLKSIAAGSGVVIAGKSLPENWAKPVVDSVMLPAHAQTSGAIYSGNIEDAATNEHGQSGGMFAGLVNHLIPNAHAQVDTINLYACITLINLTLASVNLRAILSNEAGTFTQDYSGQLPVDAVGTLDGINHCEWIDPENFTHEAMISNVTEENLKFIIDEFEFIIPFLGSCISFPEVVCID